MSNSSPTPYEDVNAILAELMTAVTPILGSQFTGLYLTGSLALGDFNPNRSDIDFIVATTDVLTDATVTTLATMHDHLRASGRNWAAKVEGDYIPLAALRRHDPANCIYPHLGDDGHFSREPHGSDMIIQFHTLREKGVTLAGPPPHTLIDSVPPEALKQAVRDTLQSWWQPMLTNHYRLPEDEYQVYAVLTMCRMLYTLRFGDVVSKPAGVKWALGAADGPFDMRPPVAAQGRRFTSLIQQANAWQNGMPFDKLDETIEFIRYTLEMNAA